MRETEREKSARLARERGPKVSARLACGTATNLGPVLAPGTPHSPHVTPRAPLPPRPPQAQPRFRMEMFLESAMGQSGTSGRQASQAAARAAAAKVGYHRPLHAPQHLAHAPLTFVFTCHAHACPPLAAAVRASDAAGAHRSAAAQPSHDPRRHTAGGSGRAAWSRSQPCTGGGG